MILTHLLGFCNPQTKTWNYLCQVIASSAVLPVSSDWLCWLSNANWRSCGHSHFWFPLRRRTDSFFIDVNRSLTISVPIEAINFYLLTASHAKYQLVLLLYLSVHQNVLRDSANTIDSNDLLLSRSCPRWFQCLCSESELLFLVFYLPYSFIRQAPDHRSIIHMRTTCPPDIWGYLNQCNLLTPCSPSSKAAKTQC